MFRMDTDICSLDFRLLQAIFLVLCPSVLLHCWFGGRNVIQPVNIYSCCLQMFWAGSGGPGST